MTTLPTNVTLPPIALTGALRSGKSAAARYLAEKYGYTEFAFGDELKRDFHRRYPEIPRTPKPRVGYQNHGQLMRELIGQDVWVDACFDAIETAEADVYVPDYTPNFRVVISDLRQPNEFTRCRAEGYVIIRIKAQSALRIHRAVEAADTFSFADLTHETEQHTDGFACDFEIVNDSSLDELYAKIDGVMAELQRKRVTQ